MEWQTSVMTVDALRQRVDAGERFEFLTFWGHTPPKDGRLGPHCLSNWYPAPFELDGQRYPTTEHHMMASKARCFDDPEVLAQILAADTPGEAKALGRKVRGFDAARWEAVRQEVVIRGNLAKFGQDEALRSYLLSTGDQILVEASPRDTIWGIGLGPSSPLASDPGRWRGRNLLGFALMEVRRQLRAA